MAAGTIPTPGKVVNGLEIGPCINEKCKHIDCAEIRQMAAWRCDYCFKEIGYETRFYKVDGQLVHADCHEQ